MVFFSNVCSVCEVFEAESIDIGLQTKVDDELQINFGTKALPDVIEGEDLLKWCKRVTVDYPSVKINDFTKSFRSGLAFCAIIHRYRPDLFESFSKLDFTDSLSSHIDNCHKAFRAAALLGVEKENYLVPAIFRSHRVKINVCLYDFRTLDAGVVVTLPDRNEIRSFLSELRMRLVDIPAVQRELSVKESDHRLSSLFNLSESETSVKFNSFTGIRQRERDEAIDLTNIPDEDHTRFSAVTPGSRKIESLTENVRLRPRKFANPFDSDSDSDGANKYVAHLTVVPQTSSTVRSITDNISGNEISISPVVAARHEELMKKRQQIAPVITDSVDAVEREKHREEARRLMNDAASDGMTMIVGGSVPTTAHQSLSGLEIFLSIKERNLFLNIMLPLNLFLACFVAMVCCRLFLYIKLAWHEQTSDLVRKLSSSCVVQQNGENGLRTLVENIILIKIRKNNLDVTLDRARRYGSMRGQELVETVAKVAGRALAASLETTKNPVSVTPTRKLISQWEKDGADLGKIQSELSRLSKCLAQVSGEDEIICSQLMKTKVSSEEEERLLQEHMRLLTEKDAIVRRTEYFNVLEQLREVEDQITKLQHELSSASNIDQDCKTEDDKQKIDKMVEDLVAFVNKKDCLSQKLISHEAEDEEIGERDRLTLEAAANFSRGLEQPLSASKRFITWFRSEISS
ncbi:unnamed protein product [Thelazia callipaeda]|uniref:Calponin-homology (CH) domain-containing protein n=1 Tax=Thelazia callipaeda TaxID=103827 RepID=A0A0N5DAE0_THECL|nr:unnamed protein product [Thelazia callipaeda]